MIKHFEGPVCLRSSGPSSNEMTFKDAVTLAAMLETLVSEVKSER